MSRFHAAINSNGKFNAALIGVKEWAGTNAKTLQVKHSDCPELTGLSDKTSLVVEFDAVEETPSGKFLKPSNFKIISIDQSTKAAPAIDAEAYMASLVKVAEETPF